MRQLRIRLDIFKKQFKNQTDLNVELPPILSYGTWAQVTNVTLTFSPAALALIYKVLKLFKLRLEKLVILFKGTLISAKDLLVTDKNPSKNPKSASLFTLVVCLNMPWLREVDSAAKLVHGFIETLFILRRSFQDVIRHIFLVWDLRNDDASTAGGRSRGYLREGELTGAHMHGMKAYNKIYVKWPLDYSIMNNGEFVGT